MKNKGKFKNREFEAAQENTKGGGRRLKKQDSRETHSLIEGIITASDWDNDGNVIEIRLQTTDEDEYLIVNGELFTGLIRKYVLVSGIIKIQRNGSKTIHIKKCTILESQQDGELVIENMT
ncbi:Uncharacterized protein dnl_49740 [Desulfonema limicola]|uniref:Uncharacterized protein n=1 Tax=Desulfonema limicola TaxID=45656 RepID=A0A975BC26_9BACT|nr:hypothetical protein [Desulfonema limicola]QTA82596.1 Uncharacterized protein dnl_49740 [Desulfonema limicola]